MNVTLKNFPRDFFWQARVTTFRYILTAFKVINDEARNIRKQLFFFNQLGVVIATLSFLGQSRQLKIQEKDKQTLTRMIAYAPHDAHTGLEKKSLKKAMRQKTYLDFLCSVFCFNECSLAKPQTLTLKNDGAVSISNCVLTAFRLHLD